MKNRILAALAMVSVGIVAGCGGGSGSGTTTPPTTSISGKVADGYLVGATVFMDKNGNYQLDADEPHAITGTDGAYTLMNIDPADVGKYPIVALATKGVTMDSDTGVVANSYVLSMPKDSISKDSISGTVNSNFISPISSQLREMMETGQYASVAQAMEKLRSNFGMPAGTNMLANYMDPNQVGGADMHAVAKQMASIMGAVGNSTSSVAGYRGMMGAIFSNISTNKLTPVDTTAVSTSITNMLTGMSTGTLPPFTQGSMQGSMQGSRM